MACEWNLLRRSEQISYLLLVHNAQNPGALAVGKLAPLNMITCVSVRVNFFSGNSWPTKNFFKVYKTIYTYLMLIYTFIA